MRDMDPHKRKLWAVVKTTKAKLELVQVGHSIRVKGRLNVCAGQV